MKFNLLIEHRSDRGLEKTWRLASGEVSPKSIGFSKHADLRVGTETIKGIEGFFESRGGHWVFVRFGVHDEVETVITNKVKVKLGNSELVLIPFLGRDELLANIEKQKDLSSSSTGRSPFQLYMVSQGDHRLETRVLGMSETFTSRYDLTKTKITPLNSEKWITADAGPLTVKHRTVYLNEVEAKAMLKAGNMTDDKTKKMIYCVAALCALFALLGILAPKQASEIADSQVIQEMRDIKLTPPPKKKMAQMLQNVLPPTEAKTQKSAGGSSKAASAIQSLRTGRITQLIGKISAQAAKSANVVITSGAAAGQQPTGRALAAVGAISQSGKDWSAEGKGTGLTISTNGKAGGKGVGGMGAISAGKTGTGGVGLIEDEGEIVGGLDRDIIAQYIKSQLGQILYCYERQLSANPDLYGKVAVKFVIGASGGVETQRIGDTTLRNATVEGCILQKVAAWKFPTPQGGTKVMVTYPFLFKSTN